MPLLDEAFDLILQCATVVGRVSIGPVIFAVLRIILRSIGALLRFVGESKFVLPLDFQNLGRSSCEGCVCRKT